VQAAAALASSLQVMLVGELVTENKTDTLVLLTTPPFVGAVIVTVGSDCGEITKPRAWAAVLPAASVATTTTV
jgi:hypothetical protein